MAIYKEDREDVYSDQPEEVRKLRYRPLPEVLALKEQAQEELIKKTSNAVLRAFVEYLVINEKDNYETVEQMLTDKKLVAKGVNPEDLSTVIAEGLKKSQGRINNDHDAYRLVGKLYKSNMLIDADSLVDDRAMRKYQDELREYLKLEKEYKKEHGEHYDLKVLIQKNAQSIYDAVKVDLRFLNPKDPPIFIDKKGNLVFRPQHPLVNAMNQFCQVTQPSSTEVVHKRKGKKDKASQLSEPATEFIFEMKDSGPKSDERSLEKMQIKLQTKDPNASELYDLARVRIIPKTQELLERVIDILGNSNRYELYDPDYEVRLTGFYDRSCNMLLSNGLCGEIQFVEKEMSLMDFFSHKMFEVTRRMEEKSDNPIQDRSFRYNNDLKEVNHMLDDYNLVVKSLTVKKDHPILSELISRKLEQMRGDFPEIDFNFKQKTLSDFGDENSQKVRRMEMNFLQAAGNASAIIRSVQTGNAEWAVTAYLGLQDRNRNIREGRFPPQKEQEMLYPEECLAAINAALKNKGVDLKTLERAGIVR
jgi:hypothetical protein